MLHAEVAAARFVALERVATHELAELEKVGDAPGPLELLVQVAAPGDADVFPERLAQRGRLVDRLLQPLAPALEPARVPQHATERAMEVVRGASPTRREQPLDAGVHVGARGPRLGAVLGHRYESRRGEIAAERARQDEVAVGETLHERAGAEAIGALVGE